MQETSVAASLFIDLAAQLETRGVAADAMCRRAGVDPAFVSRPNDRVPGSSAERLWSAAIALTGDPLLALHLTEHHRTGALSILGYVVLNCRMGLDVLERLGRFAALLNDGLRARSSTEGALVVVRFEPVPPNAPGSSTAAGRASRGGTTAPR